jgi:hypothetical protein
MPDDIAEGEALAIAEASGNALTIMVTPRKDGIPLPTLLRSLSESLKILRDIDERVSRASRPTLEWLVVSASYNSPLTLRIIGRKRIDAPVPGRVVDAYLTALNELENGGEPKDFSESAMESAKDIATLILRDGVSSVEFSAPGQPTVSPSRKLVENVENIIRKRYYYEDAMLEGKLETVSIHGDTHFVIYDVLTNHPTKCVIDEVLMRSSFGAIGKRVQVEGKVKYNRSGRPMTMEARSMKPLREASELPQFTEGQSINITGGVESSKYVRRLRDAD